MVFQIATLFHHSNLLLPVRLERYLNKVVVTPRMHGIHHSQVRKETDSNYSVVFRWWDYLQRTLYLCIPQSWIHIGVSGYDRPGANRPDAVLLMPFQRQKAPDKDAEKRREGPPSDPTTLAE
jgi:sterol desaturase/sphingolipid hydroxylase (fatty acid hydroxylase superfamily)